jgi:gluconolactonase
VRSPLLALLVATACGQSASAPDASANDDGGATNDAAPGSADARPGADAWPLTDPLTGIGSATPVATTFMFTEGPVWRPGTQVLLFSDIPANTIFRLTPPSSIDVFRADSGNSNGLREDTAGLLLAAEHGNRRVSRTLANGTIVDVATRYQGMRLNSPNDIAVRSDGTIYFSDPPYGITSGQQELSFNGVFRVDTSDTLHAEWEGSLSSRPNGVVLSPDESILYVADTTGPVRAYDVAGDGSLSNERVFTDQVSNGDGMCIDVAGNLFVTSATGVRAFGPDGRDWGTITVPKQPANCTFGGSDYRTMYITAQEGLYRVSMTIPGVP